MVQAVTMCLPVLSGPDCLKLVLDTHSDFEPRFTSADAQRNLWRQDESEKGAATGVHAKMVAVRGFDTSPNPVFTVGVEFNGAVQLAA